MYLNKRIYFIVKWSFSWRVKGRRIEIAHHCFALFKSPCLAGDISALYPHIFRTFFLENVAYIIVHDLYHHKETRSFCIFLWRGFFKKINLPLMRSLFIYWGIQFLGGLLQGQQSVKPGVVTDCEGCLSKLCWLSLLNLKFQERAESTLNEFKFLDFADPWAN